MYIGPETLMPLASILAAITGVIMLFWRRTTQAVQGGWRFLARKFQSLFGRS